MVFSNNSLLPFALGIAVVTATPAVGRTEWTQWRGPERNGISSESDWALKGKELWKVDVGLGYSTVSIADGRLYTMGFDQAKNLDHVFCFEAESGKEIWRHSLPSKLMNEAHGGGTLVTPSVDGEVVYTANRLGQFLCLDAKTGTVHWQKDLKEEYDLSFPRWGYSAAPLVLDDMVVMNMGRVLAFERKTGEEIWVSDEDYGDAYSTPADFEFQGEECLAVFNKLGLVVLERGGGTELMHHPWETSYHINAATPVVLEGDRVFISSGYNHGCAMLQLGEDAIDVVWESKAMRNHMTGCIVYEDHLYGFDDATFKCLDLEGNEQWTQRGLGKGAHLIAGGRLLLLTADGELVIAEASPEKFEELSREKILDGGVYWTTPVLLDGRLYCRNSLGQLVCRDHRSDQS